MRELRVLRPRPTISARRTPDAALGPAGRWFDPIRNEPNGRVQPLGSVGCGPATSPLIDPQRVRVDACPQEGRPESAPVWKRPEPGTAGRNRMLGFVPVIPET